MNATRPTLPAPRPQIHVDTDTVRFQLVSLLTAAARGATVDAAQAREMLVLLG